MRALRDPRSDESFMRWITEGVYEGKRTRQVMERLTRVAKEAVKPSIMSTLSDDFLDDLREQILEAVGRTEEPATDEDESLEATSEAGPDEQAKPGVVTTDEERAFAELVRSICVDAGEDPSMILEKDTTGYFNMSFRTPTRWFARLLVLKSGRVVVTRVPTDEALRLAPGFEAEDAPSAYGVSRVSIDDVSSVARLGPLLLRSLEIAK